MIINLPADPIDRHEVRWWWLDIDSIPHEARAVYHVNTPYESLPWTATYCGGSRGGYPFVDQWEVFEDRRARRLSQTVQIFIALVLSEPIPKRSRPRARPERARCSTPPLLHHRPGLVWLPEPAEHEPWGVW